MKHPDEPLLAHLCDDIDRFTLVPHCKQLGSRRIVVIPNVVMNHLEVPQAPAGPGIQREQAVAEQVRPPAIGAVKVVLRARRRRKDDATLLVDRKFAPHVRSAHALPRVLWPGLIAELAGTWNRVEGPHQLARAHVKSAYIAGCGPISLIGRGAKNQQIFKHPSGRGGLYQPNGLGIAIQSLFQVDAATVAEGENRPTRARINGAQGMVAGK